MSVELQIVLWVVGALFTVGGGAWGLIKAFAYLGEKLASAFEQKLEAKLAAITQQLHQITAEGRTRIEKLERQYESLDREVRQILIELPRQYVLREDQVKRDTVLMAKFDLLRMEMRGKELEQ